MPEAATLLAWAAELGIDIGGAGEAEGVMAAGVLDTDGIADRDALVRSLAIKGHATAEMLAPVLDVPTEAVHLANPRLRMGWPPSRAGCGGLTLEGKRSWRALLAADRDAWGQVAAEAALDGFLALDARMKLVVTAWQIKEVDGKPVLNDHADAGYDAEVLAQLAALNVEARGWIAPHVAGLPRLGAYARRLSSAADAAAAGDHRYVASPRVDSYHGVWFELHEELIRLAGRSREDEVAAGRA